MRKGAVAALVVVTILIVAGAAYLAGTLASHPGTATTQTTKLGTGSIACTVTGEGFLLLKVLNSSNDRPIGSLPIQIEAQYPACATNPPHIDDLGPFDTNASGFLPLSGPFNWFYLTANYDDGSYSANATVSAGAVTCVTLAMPTGSENITQYCNPAEYFAR